MTSLIKKLDLNKIAFSLALILIISRKYMMSFIDPNIDINSIKSLLFYSSIGILGLIFIFDSKKSISEIALVFVCGILYILNREGAILLMVLLAVAAKKIDDKYIVKNYLIISVIFLIAVILIFNLFPWLKNNNQIHYRYIAKTNSSVPRMDYGLGNPNSVFYRMIPIYGAYIFLRFKNYNLIDRLILFGSVFFIYKTTYSRTGFITIFAGLIVVEIIRMVDIKKFKPLAILAKISPMILAFMSIILGTVFYKNSWLNGILASRPKYWNVYLLQEGNFLKPFGNSYDAIVKSLYPLDNSYVYAITTLGLVTFALFMYILYKGIGSFIEKDKKAYLVVLVMFLIYSFGEELLLDSAYSFAIVLVIKEFISIDNREINLYKRKNGRI